MSVIQIFKRNGKSGFGYGSTAEEVTKDLSLQGKSILVTGCNSGLGYETARVLSLRGAQVIGTARTLDKARTALQQLEGQVVPFECELSEPASVRTCLENIQKAGLKFDALICNAGIMALPKLEQAHGLELQFFTNHIGHFMLVTGLLKQLKEQGRVVMLSSSAHQMAPRGGIDFDNLSGEKHYRDWTAYGQSKMANLLFSKELARRLKGTSQTANAVHPGVINTNLGRHMSSVARSVMGVVGPLVLKTTEQGASTQVFAAVHPSVASVSGEYFADCNVQTPRTDAENPDLAKRLWEKSEEIVAKL
jgi:WW domain-containing oxidoreductase